MKVFRLWSKHPVEEDTAAARRAKAEAAAKLERTRANWHPILEVTDDARFIRERNHFADRFRHALGTATPGHTRGDL